MGEGGGGGADPGGERLVTSRRQQKMSSISLLQLGFSYDIIAFFIDIFRSWGDFGKIWERLWKVCGKVVRRFWRSMENCGFVKRSLTTVKPLFVRFQS